MTIGMVVGVAKVRSLDPRPLPTCDPDTLRRFNRLWNTVPTDDDNDDDYVYNYCVSETQSMETKYKGSKRTDRKKGNKIIVKTKLR
jgi:hypothetical protein